VNPYQYTGRDYDPETGLRYYRARYYSADTGGFLSEDPAMFKGKTNFYAYVLNEPTKLVDSPGLKCTQVTPWTILPSISAPGITKPIFSVPAGEDWHHKPDDW
jgi:RHS repeat-associated protein